MYSRWLFLVALLVPILAVSAAPLQERSITQTGDATFYTPGIGACGGNNVDSDLIVAVNANTFDTFPGAGPNPNANPICGKQMAVSFQGKSTTVTVVDRCPGCGPADIDLSPAAFNQIADPALGRIQVTWTLLD